MRGKILLATSKIDTRAIRGRSVLTGQPARKARILTVIGGGVA
jgi:hypothetical protein